MAITEDTGNQPVAKTWTGAWTTAQTTTSFTAASDTLIIALLTGSGASPSATVTGTITDSLAGGWTLLRRENASDANLGGTAEVWVRNGGGVGTASPGAMTVSATATGSAANGGQLTVRCLLGAAITASQNGAVASLTRSTAGTIQVSVAAGTGNKVYGAAFNWSTSTNMTVLGNTTAVTQFSDATNGDSWEAFKSTGDTAGTATYGYSTSTVGRIAAVEFKAAAVTAGGGVSPARPGETWNRRFHHRQQLPPLSPVAAAPPDFSIFDGFTSVRRVPPRKLITYPALVNAPPDQVTPPRPSSLRARRRPVMRREGAAFTAPQEQLAPPVQYRRRLRRVRVYSDGDSYGPPVPQQAPPNPPITQLTTGRLLKILRGLRRPGIADQPVPTQVAAPTNPPITATVFGRYKRIGSLSRRAMWGDSAPPNDQGTAPATAPAPRARGKAFRPRYGRTPTVAPPQQAAPVNPSITQLTSARTRRLWAILRRPSAVPQPVPAQQAAAVNPSITALTGVRSRLGSRALRRGRASQPTPAQQAVVTNPSITMLTTARSRLVARLLRRPQTDAPAPSQALAPPPAPERRRGAVTTRPARHGAVFTPPAQAAPPAQPAPSRTEHKGLLRRGLDRLRRAVAGGAAPPSTAVSMTATLGATTDEQGITGVIYEGESTTGATGGGTTAGTDETGSTSGPGMTGSAQ